MKYCLLLSALLAVFFCTSSPILPQTQDLDKSFSEIIVKIDTNTYRFTELLPHFKDASLIPFYYRHENEIAIIDLIPQPGLDLELMSVNATPDISVLWFEKVTPENFFRIYLRFERITKGNFFNLELKVKRTSGEIQTHRLELQPVAPMLINILNFSEEIFIGEEAVFELNTHLPDNIVARPGWIQKDDFQYRITRDAGRVYLHLTAFNTGRQRFKFEFELFKPIMDSRGKFNYKYEIETSVVNVRASRLAFLSVDPREIIMDDDSRLKGVEIQMDNHRMLQLNKTYRVEAQEETGGALIAEIFTRSYLANNKVLALLRPYNFHTSRDGYLYIKDGDQPRYLTNFSVIPQTVITSVRIMREGRDWTDQLRVNPNETVFVRINGQSLEKSLITFDVPGGRVMDTIRWSDVEAEFRMFIPMEIPKTRVNLMVNNKPSGHALTVTEYQRPRQFDFIRINYGERPQVFDEISGPIFYESTIRDITINFDRWKIDQGGNLYGKQYLDIEVRILGPRGELLETFRLNGVAICPAENSLRYQYYNRNDCRSQEISLNQQLSRKTYSWEIWSRAVITVSHSADRYTTELQRKTVEIILQRPLRFDVDVSFPAGLLIIRPEDDRIGNLSGISMAMIAQFSFYQKNKIAAMKPYKVGAGFLALNAFNFSESANIYRDMGIVVIGSIFPTRRDTRMSFPLYVGGGYFLNQKEWFMLLGPGIRVSF